MFKQKNFLKGNTVRIIEDMTKKRITEFKTYGFENILSQDEKMQMKGRRLRVAYD